MGGFFSEATPVTSTRKKWQIETSRGIDTRHFFALASVSLFKLSFQFPAAERENIKLENKTEVALSVEKERKPLIFSPHFAINLVEKRPAADAQTADDVICNHGPLVSGRELLPLSTRGERLPLPSAFRHQINSGGSTGNPHQQRDG